MTDNGRLSSNFISHKTCHQDLYLYSVSLTVCTLWALTTQFVYCIIISMCIVKSSQSADCADFVVFSCLCCCCWIFDVNVFVVFARTASSNRLTENGRGSSCEYLRLPMKKITEFAKKNYRYYGNEFTQLTTATGNKWLSTHLKFSQL